MHSARELAKLELDAGFPFERAADVKLLALDVDGVLTDGGLYYDAEGLCLKRFDVADGVGVKLLQTADIVVALITGMDAAAVVRRAAALEITECYHGSLDKVASMTELMHKYGLGWEQVAYAGDDWMDLPLLRRAGLALTVANAQPEVRALAHYVSPKEGGRGAVRQLARHILAARGRLEQLLTPWAVEK
ncbi:MAG: HAD hydrolase family protein [Deltaproteobacteria bacterium]|nr:HAD hydrolase family protein [Deltaproteobacteria bacterium]